MWKKWVAQHFLNNMIAINILRNGEKIIIYEWIWEKTLRIEKNGFGLNKINGFLPIAMNVASAVCIA